jgi:hypothetical protein
LGFFERSLDVLQSASAVATGSAVEDVKELRRLIEQRQLEGNSKQGRNRGQHG